MSHFSVGVICKTLDRVDEMLAPYEEGGEFYFEQTPIFNRTEVITKYRKENPTSTLSDDEIWERTLNDEDPDRSHSDENNIYAYFNPNGKWDWYEIGGRWHKSLKVKKRSARYTTNNRVEADKKEKGIYRWTDAAMIKDILWKQMNTPTIKDRQAKSTLWDLYVEKGAPSSELSAAGIRPFYTREYFKNTYKTKERYIKVSSTFVTYALLTPDEGWISPGDVAWFGLDNTTTEDVDDYNKVFYEIMNKPEYQDYWLVIVDCHI